MFDVSRAGGELGCWTGVGLVHPPGFSSVSPECPDLPHVRCLLALAARVHLRDFKQLAHNHSGLESQLGIISAEKPSPLPLSYLP